MKTAVSILVTIALILPVAVSAQTSRADRLKLASEISYSLEKEMLNRWYPQCVDSADGGYLSTFTFDFRPTGPQDRFIVTQARHTWTTAKASEHYPTVEYYLPISRHGFYFLRDVMWDRVHGGFHNLVSKAGQVKSETKEAYGNAFAIYALAAFYKVSGDTSALNLAKKAFLWLEQHSHDPVRKGYFQHLQIDGTPVKRGKSTPSTSPLGYKDQNSSIHLLEAFTELYGVWKDPLVRERLAEMLILIRDTITTPNGYLALFLEPDWTPVSFRDSSQDVILRHSNLDHVSFGHDVETAYLLLEASHVLGIQHDTITLAKAKKMVDHALRQGWDSRVGGFYDEGYYFKGKRGFQIIKETKNWWAQAEGLNTLLLMADLFPNDRMRYYDKFKQQWQYIKRYLIDHEHGDWYSGGLDKSPELKTALKGHIWKGIYHQYRSLQNCVQRLMSTNERAVD